MSEDVSLESLLQKKAAPEETPAPAGLADAAASTVIIPETMSTQNSLLRQITPSWPHSRKDRSHQRSRQR